MILQDSVRDFCQRYGKNQIWIALSGGLDSRVLLDVCKKISVQTPQVFHVIHIHHGLSANADHWAAQCRQWAQTANFSFHLHTVAIDLSAGASLEGAARDQRYQVFAARMQANDLLLTAHHQDDQAETVLLQLFRGAGPKGLSAMPVIKSFAHGWHGRPLLGFSRSELLAYANTHQLDWVEDESNADTGMTRNFIRHEVMSLLKSRWPNVENALVRSASHCAESQLLLEEIAREKLPLLSGSKPDTLSVAKLLELTPSWQRLLLRFWIEEQGFDLPDTNKLFSMQTSVLGAARDRMPCVEWAGAVVRRHCDDLYIMKPVRPAQLAGAWHWDMMQPLSLSSGYVLTAAMATGRGLKADIGTVTIRFRMKGESVAIGARGKVALKNLFQEWRVPVWERGSIPLVFCGDRLVQVPGYFMDAAYAAGEGEDGVTLSFNSV